VERLKVLGVAPRFDEATEYSYKWYRRLKNKIKDKVELRDLTEAKATRQNFEAEIKAFNPDCLVFYDHGTENCLVQQGGQGCILDTKNVKLVSHKVVYTMACLSAKKLGVEAWKRGAVYVGYIEVFAFTTYDEKLFCEAANYGFVLYVNGEKDWAKIKKAMLSKFDELIAKATDPWTKIWLRHDRDALRVYNGEAPTPTCAFRKLSVKLFGAKIGWRLTRKTVIGVAFQWFGYGGMIHDFILECGKISNPWRWPPHGFWIYLALSILGFAVQLIDYAEALKLSHGT